MWQVDREAKVTFYEGGILAATPGGLMEGLKSKVLGRNLYEGLASSTKTKEFDVLKSSVDRVLSGESDMEIIETSTSDNSRWFRSRLVAQKGYAAATGTVDANTIVGVIGISMEVTEIKKKEEENVKLLAAEAAAKEASKMKSNFLANMSHEIRTPIAGILGMSELIMDTTLNEEQNDFAQNIHRSANTLLTVINDVSCPHAVLLGSVILVDRRCGPSMRFPRFEAATP
jgi:signal transduction histidine kinase